MTIGQSIRAARESKGWSISQLSRKADVANQTIWQWETGRAMPTVLLLICVADALDVTLDELVGRGSGS